MSGPSGTRCSSISTQRVAVRQRSVDRDEGAAQFARTPPSGEVGLERLAGVVADAQRVVHVKRLTLNRPDDGKLRAVVAEDDVPQLQRPERRLEFRVAGHDTLTRERSGPAHGRRERIAFVLALIQQVQGGL